MSWNEKIGQLIQAKCVFFSDIHQTRHNTSNYKEKTIKFLVFLHTNLKNEKKGEKKTKIKKIRLVAGLNLFFTIRFILIIVIIVVIVSTHILIFVIGVMIAADWCQRLIGLKEKRIRVQSFLLLTDLMWKMTRLLLLQSWVSLDLDLNRKHSIDVLTFKEFFLRQYENDRMHPDDIKRNLMSELFQIHFSSCFVFFSQSKMKTAHKIFTAKDWWSCFLSVLIETVEERNDKSKDLEEKCMRTSLFFKMWHTILRQIPIKKSDQFLCWLRRNEIVEKSSFVSKTGMFLCGSKKWRERTVPLNIHSCEN